jgi:hypothetical protein
MRLEIAASRFLQAWKTPIFCGREIQKTPNAS